MGDVPKGPDEEVIQPSRHWRGFALLVAFTLFVVFVACGTQVGPTSNPGAGGGGSGGVGGGSIGGHGIGGHGIGGHGGDDAIEGDDGGEEGAGDTGEDGGAEDGGHADDGGSDGDGGAVGDDGGRHRDDGGDDGGRHRDDGGEAGDGGSEEDGGATGDGGAAGDGGSEDSGHDDPPPSSRCANPSSAHEKEECALAAAQASLRSAQAAFPESTEMKQGVESDLIVRLQFGHETIDTSGISGTVGVATVKMSKKARVCLRGPGDAFEIGGGTVNGFEGCKPPSCVCRDDVLPEKGTQDWIFRVRPLRAGDRVLEAEAYALLRTDTGEQPQFVKTWNADVHVAVSPAFAIGQLVRDHSRWLLVLLTSLVGLAVWWGKQKYTEAQERNKTEAEERKEREAEATRRAAGF